MKTFFKSIPLPMCGLILAILSLGNLIISYNFKLLGEIISVLGVIFMGIILAKIIFVFEHVKNDLKNNVIASTFPTFTMGAMVICTDLMRWFPQSHLVKYLWLFLIVLQFCIIFYFTYTFLIANEVTINHIYPSWFVIYCGLGIVPITSANFYPIIGKIIFWLALIFYILLLPIVIYRVFIHQKFQKHELPIITITAAPGSLCLTGYLSAFAHPNLYLVIGLLVVSQLLYLIIVISLPKLLKIDFYPSYAAFTFPMVISATAITKTYTYLTTLNINLPILNYIAIIETIIAASIVTYVFIKYFKHIILANIKHLFPKTNLNDMLDK